MVATTLPAVVRVVDLPTGTTITGAELLEVVQTASGVGQSIQVPIAQIMTTSLGGLPTGGATGQLLAKTSGTNFVTNFSSIISFVAVGTSLATTGSATSIVAFVPNQGISSTQIANNAVGTNQVASSLGIASSLSIGGLITVGGTATVTGTTILNGGLQVVGTTLVTGTFGQVGTSLMTGLFGVVGTTVQTGTFTVIGTSTFTGNFGLNVLGTTLVTGALGIVGTSQFTGSFNVLGTSNFTGVHNVVGTTNFTGGLFNVNGGANFSSFISMGGQLTITYGSPNFTIQDIATSFAYFQIIGSGGGTPARVRVGSEGTGGGALFSGAAANAAVIGTIDNNILQMFTNNALRVTLGTSGGLSIGTTTDLGAGTLNATGRNSILSGTALSSTATAVLLFGSIASFGIYIGTGVPAVNAGTGSIFMRNDGTNATSRMYVNLNGTGTWTAFNTVA